MQQREVWNSLAGPWSTYRTRVWPETKEFLRAHSGLILDLGCGSGRNFEKVEGRIIGIDFSPDMLRFAKQCIRERKLEAELVCGDITQLPFRDEIFDATISISTLQCIRGRANRLKTLKELHRVLKKNSEALITVWNRSQPRFKGRKEGFIPWKHEGKTYMRYYYLFGQKELEKLLQSTGFEIVDIHGSSAKAFNLFSRNIITVARKV